MAFKQKSGSPFQRNFGVGKSPAKQQSPTKNYQDMKKYSKEDDAVQFGEDAPTDMQKTGKTATYMKSGFKMKSSPFQRNFGIGDSPMKKADPDAFDLSWVDESARGKSSTPSDIATKVKEATDLYQKAIEGKSQGLNPMIKGSTYGFKDWDMSKEDFQEMYPTLKDYLEAHDITQERTHEKGTTEEVRFPQWSEGAGEIQSREGEVKADDYRTVYYQSKDDIKSGAIDWDLAFTEEDGLAAANQAFNDGLINVDKKNELVEKYNQQITDRDEGYTGEKGREKMNEMKTEKAKELRSDMSSIPENVFTHVDTDGDGVLNEVELLAAADLMLEGNEEYDRLTEGTETARGGEYIVDAGESKEEFDDNFIKRKMNKKNNPMTRSEAKQALADYYAGRDVHIGETKTEAFDE